MGDDFGVFLPRDEISQIDDLLGLFLGYGFEVEAEPPSYEFEQVEFCQMRPIHCGEWMCVRGPACLEKDLIRINDNAALSPQNWAYAVGECGYTWCKSVPVYHAFYTWLKHNGTKTDKPYSLQEGGLSYWSKRLPPLPKLAITEETRLSFERAFGIAPTLQIEMEQFYLRGCPPNQP